MEFKKQEIVNQKSLIDKLMLDAFQEGIIEGIRAAEKAQQDLVSHNTTDETSHADIRKLVADLANSLDNLVKLDLGNITKSVGINTKAIQDLDKAKVSINSIVNLLTSDDTDKPLSAQQGKKLKGLIDDINKTIEQLNQKLKGVSDTTEGLRLHPILIGENSNWWIWDGTEYQDSGKPSLGKNGLSTYEIAVKYGYKGTEEEWYSQTEADRVAAQRYAMDAHRAKIAVEDMTVSAEALPNGAPASVVKSFLDGRFNIHFGLPQGNDGSTPYIGPNDNWWFGESDTGYPSRGEQGANGVTAPANGFITFRLTPEGYLAVAYCDTDNPPRFRYDRDSGEVYYIID